MATMRLHLKVYFSDARAAARLTDVLGPYMRKLPNVHPGNGEWQYREYIDVQFPDEEMEKKPCIRHTESV